MSGRGGPCPVWGIVPSDLLEPAAYEVVWEAIPELRAAQDAGAETYCPECGRQLSYGEGEGIG